LFGFVSSNLQLLSLPNGQNGGKYLSGVVYFCGCLSERENPGKTSAQGPRVTGLVFEEGV
jgi:hypothetical protein